MSLFSSHDNYLGVDIGASGIKLVELRKAKGRPQLWTYGIAEQDLDIHIGRREKTPEELAAEGRQGVAVGADDPSRTAPMSTDDPRIEQYASLLKQLLQQTKTTTKRVTASLPVSYVFHSVFTLPFVEEKKRDAIIKAELAKVISRPVNEMQVVHQVLNAEEKNPDYLRVLVTAAPRELVAFYTAIFQEAGLQLEELETEAFALERSLVGHDTATSMVIDMGAERTNFFIMDQGVPMTHRSIQIGGNSIQAVLARQLGRESDLDVLVRDISRGGGAELNVAQFQSILDPVLKEVEYSFDLFLQQTGNEEKRPQKIVLTGGSSQFPLLRQELERAFKLRVFIGDPWARVVHQQGLRPALDPIASRMSVALGLALRNIVDE